MSDTKVEDICQHIRAQIVDSILSASLPRTSVADWPRISATCCPTPVARHGNNTTLHTPRRWCNRAVVAIFYLHFKFVREDAIFFDLADNLARYAFHQNGT